MLGVQRLPDSRNAGPLAAAEAGLGGDGGGGGAGTGAGPGVGAGAGVGDGPGAGVGDGVGAGVGDGVGAGACPTVAALASALPPPPPQPVSHVSIDKVQTPRVSRSRLFKSTGGGVVMVWKVKLKPSIFARRDSHKRVKMCRFGRALRLLPDGPLSCTLGRAA